MKILIVSKFFYIRGGAEAVVMNTRDLLMRAGHEVRVFAMAYPANVQLPESSEWASEVEFGGSLSMNVKAFARLMGLGDVADKFWKVLNDFRPDVVHCHNIHSYLSPVVVTLAHSFGVRTVWTMHDLKLVCPAYLGRRPDGSICSDCVDGKNNLMKYCCLKGSRFASFMALLESVRWNRALLGSATDCFIAPSEFLKTMMVRGGFPTEKIRVLNNFIDPQKIAAIQSEGVTRRSAAEPYFAYAGRLSPEKGVRTLVEAAVKAGVSLKVAGDGPLRAELEELARGSRVEFLGSLDPAGVISLMCGAAASVMPSECYENNPLSVIESLCAGTPVIGANIGGVPELIVPGISGEHFISGNVESLVECLLAFRPERYDRAALAADAAVRFSSHTHLKKLLQIYSEK